MYFLGTSADKNDQTGLTYSTDLIHWTDDAQEGWDFVKAFYERDPSPQPGG